ncbi:MAG: ThuA domain-containing protein [Planctomycetota bacterium]|jgi:type 1 glutamine amidotransferase
MRQLLFVTIVLLLSVSSAQADTKTKVLFVGKQPDHPFGTHMYLHTCGMLAKCLSLNGEIESIVSDGWPKDTKVLDGVSTIVVYTTPAAEFLLDAPHRDQVTTMLDRGVGLVTIHWASSIFEQNLDRLGPTWLSHMGATWISNVGLHTGESSLKQLVPDHPICRGWKNYDIHDEYYLNPRIVDATPQLQIIAKEKPVVVGWSYERDNGGRSFGTTLGHFYRNFQREPFRRMIVNSILWTAKVDVPEGGAKVNVSEADLALPPKPGQ